MNHIRNSPDEWTAAHYRLDDYFRAHGFRDRLFQTQLILEILAEAQKRHRRDPSIGALDHTFDVAEERMTRWFTSLHALSTLPKERILCTGKVYLYLTHALEAWPTSFMSPEMPPQSLVNEINSVCLVPSPDLEVSVMIPREPITLNRSETILNPLRPWATYAVILFALVAGSLLILSLLR